MKLWAVYIILLFPILGFGQTTTGNGIMADIKSSPKLKVAFSMYNHAERIFNGVTTFILTDSLIEVKKQYFGDKKSKVVYSNIISDLNQLLSEFKKVRLDSLENYYFNDCVMIISGNEYFFDFVCGSTEKSVSLHHYYVKEIAEIVKLINSTLPDKYQFRYVSKDTQQGCK
jgi:hypothetical protein